jgi:hypothetical protein
MTKTGSMIALLVATTVVWASLGAQQPPGGAGAGTQAPPAGEPQGRGRGADPGQGVPPTGGRAGGPIFGRGGGPPAPSVELNRMDHGPFISSTIATEPVTEKAIAIKVSKDPAAVIAFDTDLLRVSAAWTGGVLNWYAARDGLANWPTPAGTIHFATRKGPGWTRTGSFQDPRQLPIGPLPKTWGHYKGLYLNGNDVVLSYTVGQVPILEAPGYLTIAERPVFARTFNVAATSDALSLRVLDLPDSAIVQQQPGYVRIRRFGRSDNRFVGTRSLPGGAKWSVVDQQLVLHLPSLAQPARFELSISPVLIGNQARVPAFVKALSAHVSQSAAVPDLSARRAPGPPRWPAVETEAVLGTGDGPLLVDTFTIPESNPWQSWIRLSGFDFLNDGRAVVSSVSGDVWLVSGIGPNPGRLQWKRFATGLNQPLGLKVVNDRIYVTGRDQITILNDLNDDGEADFYENCNNDVIAADNFHEFTLHLETDSKGNFYFAKGTHWPAITEDGEVPHTPHNGVLFRMPPDGSRLETVATGLRHPNGLAIGPNDQIAYADNQGNWVPTSVVHQVKQGAVFGFAPTAQTQAPPADFEKPIVWLPHAFDNSPGSPIWIPANAWGPLAGRMLLTSYGKATLSLLLTETVGGQIQGGIMNLPLRFDSGLMRARWRPDGHLYLAGLSNWQSDGSKKGGFHRVRYTGKPLHLPAALNVRPNAIQLTFSDPLEPQQATDLQNYNVQQGVYRWHAAYGSPLYKQSDPNQQGMDRVDIKAVRLSRDRKTITLEIPGLAPVMHMQIGYILKAADGTELRHTIHSTINRIPSR